MAKKRQSTGNTFLSNNLPSYKQVKKQRKQAQQQAPKVQPKQAQRVVRGGGSQYSVKNDKYVKQNQQRNNPQPQKTQEAQQTSYLKNSLDRQGQPRASIPETSRSGVVNHGKDKQSTRLSQNYLKNTTQQKSLGNRFLDDKSKIGVDKNNRIDRLTKGAAKQKVGGWLSGVGNDSNIYNETKKDLDDQLRNGKINKKTYDANMKAAMQSDTRMRRLKNWESSNQHKAYQELARKGEKIQTSGDKDIAKGMKGLNHLQKVAAGAYTSSAQMAMDLAFGPGALVSMGVSVYGNTLHSTKQLVDKGVISKKEAEKTAFLQASKEVGTEALGRGVGLAAELKGAGAPTRSLETMKNIGIDRLVSRIKNTTARNIAGSAMKLGSGAAEEAGEELLGGILDAPITNFSYANRLDKDYRSKLQENSNNIAAQRDSLIKQGYTRKQATKLYQNEISSQEFLDNLTDDYIQNGLSKKAARKQASNMQAYLSASLNGNSKQMKAADNKMAAGIKQKFSASDTIDAMLSAGLSAAVTGAAGEVRTNTTGANIKAIYQAQNGVDGAAKAITSLAKGLDDKKMAARATAMYDCIDSGKGVDLSNEQYYTLQSALQAQFTKNAQDAAAATRAGRNSAAKSRYITAATANVDNTGKIRFGTTVNAMDEQGRTIPQFVPGGVTEARADAMRSDLNRLATQQEKQTKEHLSDKDEVIEHIVAIENGYVMPESTEFFTDAFPENRALYEQFTGETLPADNSQMRQYLFNRSAQNYEASARLETIDRIDRDKGQLDSEIANTYGQEGQQTFQKLSNNIGLEDTGKYVAYSSALGQAYDAGLSGASIDSAMKLARDAYGIGEQDITDMYQAGVADKDNGSIGATVRYDMADRTSIRNSDRDALLAFARAFGRNIVVTDNLTVDKAKDIQSNKALREDYNGPQVDGMFYDNTIYINLAEGNNRSISYTIMHELTHSLKEQFAADYAEFADLFKERYVEKYGEAAFNKAIQDRIDLYKDSGVNLDREGALEEIICDQMGEVLTDEDFVQNVAENHPDLAHSLLYAIKTMLQKIRNLFAQYEGFPPRYNEALLSQLDLLKDAEKLLMQAMEHANENRVAESEAEARYLFGGPKADNPKGYVGTTMEEDPNFKKAQEMKNNSASDEEIWAETGWQYNNGNWRFEIDDTDFDIFFGDADLRDIPEYKRYQELERKRFSAYVLGTKKLTDAEEKEYQNLNDKWSETAGKQADRLEEGDPVFLDKMVRDRKLFMHYPSLKDVRVYTVKDLTGKTNLAGGADLSNNDLYIDYNLLYDVDKLRNVLLHEVQHFIQRYEGRNSGTNPTIASSIEAYESNQGEREAQEAGARINMSAEQRRGNMPRFSITGDMSDVERYNELKDKSLTVVQASRENLPFTKENFASLQNESKVEAKKAAQNLIRELGIKGQYETAELDFDVELSNGGVRESAQKEMKIDDKDAFINLSTLFYNLQDVMHDAILIDKYSDKAYLERHPDHKPNHNIKWTYVLLSAFAEGIYIIPTKITVFEYKIDSAPKIHLAIAAKKIEKTRVIAEPANKGLRESAVASSFNVKLSQFLPLVKDKALADYIPPQFESEGKVEDVQGLELGHGRTDSEGNALTEQQQRYFQDSKVRNVSGNLQIVYHGTDADFTVFKDSDSGNYFTSDKKYAKRYGKNVDSYYLNIVKPFDIRKSSVKKDFEQFVKDGYSNSLHPSSSKTEIDEFIRDGIDWTEADNLIEWIEENNKNYDGLIIKEPDGTSDSLSYVTFKSNQAKLIDNKDPSSAQDIRFATRHNSILTEDSSGFKVVPATENEFKGSVIRNEAGQLERMYINAETFAGGDSRFTSYSVTGDLGSSLDGMYGYSAHNVLGEGDDAVYLNVHKPATENDLTITRDQLKRLIRETIERIAIPGENGEKDYSGAWIYNYANKNDTLETAAGKAADAIISADGMTDAYVLEELYDNANVSSETEARAFYNDVNYYTGIDGIISDADDGSQVVIAFKSEQIKQTANAGEPGEMPRVESVLQYASDYGYDTDPVTGEGYPEDAKSRVVKNRDEVMAYIKNSERNATKLTHDTVLNEKTVKGNIKELVNGVMDNTDNTPGEKREALDKAMDAARELWGIYASTKYFTKAKPDDLKLFRDVAIQTAHDIVKGARYIDDEAYDNYKQVTSYLKSTRIMYTAHDAADVDMGDPGSFRRKYFGRIRLSKDGVSLEDVWADIGPMIAFAEGSDYVKDDVDHQVILEEIASFLDNSEAYYDMEADAARLDIERQLAEDIVETVTTNGDPWNSFADKKKAQYDERIAQLKARQKEAMREAKDKWKEQEKKSRKKRYEKRRQQKKERHKNYKERMKSWGHIQKNYDYLSKRLLDPKKDEGQNIPENLRVPLAKVLKEFDLQTKRSAKIEKKKGTSKATAALRDLRNEIAKIASEDGTAEFVCHPSLFTTMDRLVDSLDGKSLRELNNENLADIDDMLAQIKHMIAEQNTLFTEGKRQAVESAGRQVMDDMRAKEKKYGRGYTYSGAKGLIRHIFNEDMMTPGDFFELMGGELGTMGDHLRESFDDYIQKFKQTADFTTTTFNRFMNVKKPGSVMEDWKTDKSSQTFKLDSGEEVTMTVAQMMSLYCMSKREAAMNHIMGSGIVLSEVTPGRKIDELVGGKQENRVEAVRMSYFDVQRIIEALTKEQRQVADELQGMMTGTLADWGNETSMQLYGIKLFKDDFYFPIKVSNSYLTGKLEDPAGINGSRILSFSFTKPLVEQASNPLIVGDIFDIFTDHANKMALYSSFAASLLDFNRVYNYKHRSEETGLLDGSVKQAIEDAYGKRSITYINNFLDDINGQAAQRDDGITQAISVSLNRYKRAAIGINLRVLVQQPTAIMRSLYYLSPKYFTPDCFTHLLKKKQEMHEHCPIAYWKANGNYQTDFTRTLQDQMFNRWSKYDAATMGFYGLADDLTWTVIWGAVKNEIEAKYPKVKVGSEEYWTLCNRRATEVFDRTQVVDSVFHRSDAMRSTNGLTKMASSFMAEPTRTYNMLRSSIVKAHRMSIDGDRKGAINEMTKVITVLILNAATVSATSAVIDALRGKGDDDDDKSFYEKWLLNFWENFAQNANPLLQVVWVKDIATLFIDEWQGNDWGTSNMALEGWYKLAKGFAQVQKVFSGEMGFIEWISGDFGAGLGYVLGVPYYNFIRDAKSLWSMLELPTFASDGTEESEEESINKPSLLDYERNPIKVQDGSWGDNVLNHFGINLTKEERRQKAYDQELAEIKGKTEGLSGSEKRDKVNSLVMEGYTKYVEDGDTAALKRMRHIIKDAGGSTKDFDEKVGKRVASEYKKTINTKDVGKQEALQDYLLHHGWSQEDISSQIVYYSDTARKFKAAAQLDDEDAMVKALVPLMDAGLTDADVYRLYENRNRGGSRSKGSGDSTGSLAVPTYGTITSGFGYRARPTAGASTYHEGIDIGAAMGSKVDAADGGTVVYTGYNGGYGNQIVVQHSNGMKTYYSHLANIGVSPGQRVSKGQYIGNVGSTGTSTGPHLDFRVQVNGSFVNPMKYING